MYFTYHNLSTLAEEIHIGPSYPYNPATSLDYDYRQRQGVAVPDEYPVSTNNALMTQGKNDVEIQKSQFKSTASMISLECPERFLLHRIVIISHRKNANQ